MIEVYSEVNEYHNESVTKDYNLHGQAVYVPLNEKAHSNNITRSFTSKLAKAW